MESTNSLYSVYDVKAQRYGPMFESQNDAVAGRQFAQVLTGITEQFRSEYKLMKLGTIDFITGELCQLEKPYEVPNPYSFQG
ncbi:MAG: nonstructural protein [Microvirus sp.]|nr:MAG: nonstructural protein [Microvirus sp.]